MFYLTLLDFTGFSVVLGVAQNFRADFKAFWTVYAKADITISLDSHFSFLTLIFYLTKMLSWFGAMVFPIKISKHNKYKKESLTY